MLANQFTMLVPYWKYS